MIKNNFYVNKRVELNDEIVFSENVENSGKNVKMYFAGPNDPAANAMVDQLHISSPVVPCGGICVFDENY